MFTIVVAQENAFVFQTEGHRVPFQRKFFQKLIALDHEIPIAVFTFNNVAEFIVGSANGREIKPVHRSTERFVIAQLVEDMLCVGQPQTAAVGVPPIFLVSRSFTPISGGM